MILNDIWSQFNRLIQSNDSTDISRKENALNIAQRYLIERMMLLSKSPDEFLTDPTNITNTIDTNYISNPSDFLSLHRLWYRSGSQFLPFGKNAIITYDDLLYRAGPSFFDTNVNGTPTIASVKEPKTYFDQHFNNTYTTGETITGGTSSTTATVSSLSGTTLTVDDTTGFTNGEVITGGTSGTTATITVASGTTLTIAITGGTKDIKMSYYKYPVDILVYDQLNISSIVGTFQAEEVLEGNTSNASATIKTVGDTYLYLYTDGSDGTFLSGETVQGVTSGATATADAAITQKPQTLEWGEKYKFLLTQSWSLIWLHMKNNNDQAPRSDIVDELINMMGLVNRHNEVSIWGTNTNGISN